MSTQMAPLPVTKAGPVEKTRPAPTGKTTTSRSGQDGQVGHHTRKSPNGHLCTCGRLREECVRDTVRALWRDAQA